MSPKYEQVDYPPFCLLNSELFIALELMFQTNSVCHLNISELKCQDVKLNQIVMDFGGKTIRLEGMTMVKRSIGNKSSLRSNISSVSIMFYNSFLVYNVS